MHIDLRTNPQRELYAVAQQAIEFINDNPRACETEIRQLAEQHGFSFQQLWDEMQGIYNELADSNL